MKLITTAMSLPKYTQQTDDDSPRTMWPTQRQVGGPLRTF